MVKIGVIGTGRMGQRHCRVISGLPRTELGGVYDQDQQTAQQVAAQYEAPAYERLEDLLDNVTAVVIATPTAFHFEQALRCLQRGRHVLIEKPMAETLDQAQALARAADASACVVQVGHIERFNPAYIELKNVLQQTKPLAINFRRLSPFESSNADVDVVLDLMIHDIDLLLDVGRAKPAAVSACGLMADSGTLDHVTAQIWFESGPLVSLTASRVTEQKIRSIDVTAREGYLECDLLSRSILVHRSTIGEYHNGNERGFKYRQESVVERIYVPNFEPLFLELQHFVDCIVDGKTPDVTAADGLEALRWAMRVREASQSHLVDMRSWNTGMDTWSDLTPQPATTSTWAPATLPPA